MTRGRDRRRHAEAEACPDDALIAELVICGGLGATSKMHGIRAGLSGTDRQRTPLDHTCRDHESERTVEIDPPDSAPNQEGHVVAVPDAEATVITITATSPDGTAQSGIKYIALRSDASEQQAAQLKHPRQAPRGNVVLGDSAVGASTKKGRACLSRVQRLARRSDLEERHSGIHKIG